MKSAFQTRGFRILERRVYGMAMAISRSEKCCVCLQLMTLSYDEGLVALSVSKS
jgi:hypothetical protein